MPVPRVGFSASKTGISGIKMPFAPILRTVMEPLVVPATFFGALMIGSTITG